MTVSGLHLFRKASPMLGFSFSWLCREGSDTEATRGWTEEKPWEIAWGELRWEGVDGVETVGNSLGRAPLRRSDAEATTRWTERKPWEIIPWGELWWEGARGKRRQGGRSGNRRKYPGESSVEKERCGSDDTMDGEETVGNSLGRALLWEGARRKRRQGGRKGNRRKYSLGRAPLGGRDILRSRAVGTGFQDKFYQCDRPENCAPKTFQAVCKHWAMGHAYSFVGRGRR